MQLDSLLKIWNNKNQQDTTRLKALNDIITNVYLNTHSDSVYYYAQLQFDFASKTKQEKYQAKALHIQSRCFFQEGNYTKSLVYSERSLKIRKKIGDKKGEASSLNLMANVFKDQGNDAKAMIYYTKSLKIRESINDLSGVGGCLNNIGNIYKGQVDYKKAIAYYTKSLKKFEEANDKSGISAAYGSLGETYQLAGEHEKAMAYLLDCLNYLEQVGDKRNIAIVLSSIGIIYSEQNNFEKALEYLNRALKLSKENNDKHCMSIAYSGLSKAYTKNGNTEKAILYANKCLELNKEVGLISGSEEISYDLYSLYKKTKNYKDALEMHELFVLSKDSIMSEQNQKEVMSQEFQYNYEKKALADSLDFINKKKMNDLQHKAELQVEQNQRYALYGGLFLVIVFSLFIFNRFKVTQKQKRIIEHQKFQIVESINYSQKIQASLLPNVTDMQKCIRNLVVFFDPKDIVSGDFYWFKEFERFTVLACVDCTGHGVPGGFMSTLGNLLLDKVVTNSLSNPAEILSHLSKEIIRVLHQEDGGTIQDGMDLSICLIDKETKKIEFSGARNGIIVVSNGLAKRYKADLYPVGGNYMKKDKPVERIFKTQNITLTSDDWVYMYTDGFMEQLGGKENLPMNYTQFEERLIKISIHLSAEEKNKIIKTQIENWRGRNERTDDILIMGFQVP